LSSEWFALAAKIATAERRGVSHTGGPAVEIALRRRAAASCALIASERNAAGVSDAVDAVLSKLGGRSRLVEALPKSRTALDELEAACQESQSRQPIPVGLLYQALSSVQVLNDRIGSDPTASERRLGGVYYTPDVFADRAVAQLLDTSRTDSATIKERIRDGWTPEIADLSVGTGAFPQAFLRVMKREGVSPARLLELTGSMWVVDVDPYALELACLAISDVAGDPHVAAELTKRAIHGNALLLGDGASPSERVAIFDSGFVNHEAHAIPGLPDVDVVFGNPPWERLRIEDRAFFRELAPDVSTAPTATERAHLKDEALLEDSRLASYYAEHREQMKRACERIRTDSRFALSASGELLTHALFTELALRVTEQKHGWTGVLVKSTMLTSTGHARLFRSLADEGRLREAWGFTNARKLFPIDSRERFSFIICGPAVSESPGIEVASHLTDPAELGMTERLALVSQSDRYKLNPGTGLLPARLDGSRLRLLSVLSRVGVPLADAYPDIHFGRILHLTNHAEHIFKTPLSDSRLPVYEGRLVHQCDGRYATFEGVPENRLHQPKAGARRVPASAKLNPAFVPQSRFYVDVKAWASISRSYEEPWSLVWRSASSHGNTHPVIATLLPHGPTLQSLQLLQLPGSDAMRLLGLLGLFNSSIFGWSVRQRMGGIDVTSTVLRDVPVPTPGRWHEVLSREGRRLTVEQHVATKVASLLADDRRMLPVLREFTEIQPTGHVAESRARIMADIDELVAWAYGISTGDEQELIGNALIGCAA
jgi:hypothetical protein